MTVSAVSASFMRPFSLLRLLHRQDFLRNDHVITRAWAILPADKASRARKSPLTPGQRPELPGDPPRREAFSYECGLLRTGTHVPDRRLRAGLVRESLHRRPRRRQIHEEEGSRLPQDKAPQRHRRPHSRLRHRSRGFRPDPPASLTALPEGRLRSAARTRLHHIVLPGSLSDDPLPRRERTRAGAVTVRQRG